MILILKFFILISTESCLLYDAITNCIHNTKTNNENFDYFLSSLFFAGLYSDSPSSKKTFLYLNKKKQVGIIRDILSKEIQFSRQS